MSKRAATVVVALAVALSAVVVVRARQTAEDEGDRQRAVAARLMRLVDSVQVCRQRDGRQYTSRLVDVARVYPEITVQASDHRLTIDLGASSDGSAYTQRVRGQSLDYTLLRVGRDAVAGLMPEGLVLSDRPVCAGE